MAAKKSQAEKLAYIEEVCVNSMFSAVEKICIDGLSSLERDNLYKRIEIWGNLYAQLKSTADNQELLTTLAVDKIKEQYT